jgi:hypothetical protein
MPGKILRRCTICKKFHASYLLVDPALGKLYLCPSCWKARSSSANTELTDANTTAPEVHVGSRPSLRISEER